MGIRVSARIGAFACLGVALAMAALALRAPSAPDAGDPMPSEMAVSADPLQARLLRCQQAGEAAGSDRDCLAAWAENRRRFLGPGRARPAGPVPSDSIGGGAPDRAADRITNIAEPKER